MVSEEVDEEVDDQFKFSAKANTGSPRLPEGEVINCHGDNHLQVGNSKKALYSVYFVAYLCARVALFKSVLFLSKSH